MLTKQKIPKAELDKILDKYDLGRVYKIEPLATSGNITYKIKSQKGMFLLRLCPRGPRWRSKKEILAELELMHHLLKHKFPVPKPVLTKNNDFAVSWKQRFGYLREYVSARPKLNPTPKEVRKFGVLLGQYHKLIENYKTKNPRTHIWGLKKFKRFFKKNKNRIIKSKLKKSKQFVETLEKELDKLHLPDSLPKGMIHEDMGKRHVLWKNNKPSCVIDFDRCYYGKLLADLGQACRGWCFTNNWSKWSSKNFQALISGYESKRKLTKLEKKYLTDAIKFAVLERGLAFALRFIEMTHDRDDEKYAWHSVSRLVAKIKTA